MTKPAAKTKPSRRAAAAAKLSRFVGRVGRLFGKKGKAPVSKTPPKETSHKSSRPLAPTKAETRLLPPFPGLPLNRIHVPKTKAECKAAAAAILAAGIAGFDTEAKPSFKVGEKSLGPHVVQFALTNEAYIFQIHGDECLKVAADLIASQRVLKIGFGLRNDHGQIRDRLGVKLNHVIDLDHVFKKKGYKGQIGVRAAMGALLNRSFPKSKSTTMSNWAADQLSPKQLLYAANDAYAALKIMEALDPKELNETASSPKANPKRAEPMRSPAKQG